MKKIITFILFALFLGAASAATLEGKVIAWKTLQPLNNAVIDINSVPNQRIVSSNGYYSVSLEPGVYEIQAVYYEKGNPSLYALEEVEIRGEGRFVFDLILFPISEADLDRLNVLEGKEESVPEKEIDLTFILIIALVLLALLISFFFILKEWKNKGKKKIGGGDEEKKDTAREEKKEEIKEKPEEKMDKYALEVIDVLKRSGNRLTQKELIERVSVGEAKVSLIISELVEMGIVKKIKKGRGNIIILKK